MQLFSPIVFLCSLLWRLLLPHLIYICSSLLRQLSWISVTTVLCFRSSPFGFWVGRVMNFSSSLLGYRICRILFSRGSFLGFWVGRVMHFSNSLLGFRIYRVMNISSSLLGFSFCRILCSRGSFLGFWVGRVITV